MYCFIPLLYFTTVITESRLRQVAHIIIRNQWPISAARASPDPLSALIDEPVYGIVLRPKTSMKRPIISNCAALFNTKLPVAEWRRTYGCYALQTILRREDRSR